MERQQQAYIDLIRRLVRAERDSGPVDARKWDRVHRVAATIGPERLSRLPQAKMREAGVKSLQVTRPDGSKWTYHRHDA
jgi:hypothetical protein